MQAHESNHQQNKISVTVLVDGEPQLKTFPANEKVKAVIISLLTPSERPHADGYMLTDSSQTPPKELNPDESLNEAGVEDGHILSLTKKDGGGGGQE